MKYPKVALILVLLGISNPAFADLQIAFYSDRDGVRGSLFLMNPDGSNPVNLSNELGVELGIEADPQWSPDGTKILFESKHTGDNEVFLMDADGSNLANLTNNPEKDTHPRWSPDGTKILWTRRPHDAFDGDIEIFVMDADGSNQRSVGNGGWTHWSPDGKMIGFASDGAHIMNADGTGRRKVADRFFDTRFLSWSPDGKKVAFAVYNKPAGPAIIDGEPAFDAIGRAIWDIQMDHVYVVNVDGSDLVELTKDLRDYNCYGAAWSPDGTKIAFERLNGFIWSEIYVVNVDGTNPTRLTKARPSNRRPSWSPDGSRIVFESMRDGNREIYIMNADGSNQINLTNHPSRDQSPSWIWFDLPTTSVSPQEKLVATWGQIKVVANGQ